MDTEAMQRLRWIRQNGLAHFVFNTMEHSRFAHSLGVAFVARRMMDRVLLNSGLDGKEHEENAWTWKYETIAAALLHDIGHGPFSHSLEEILRAIHPGQPKDKQFDHED
jgi:HD superfamily phosphohydrolase